MDCFNYKASSAQGASGRVSRRADLIRAARDLNISRQEFLPCIALMDIETKFFASVQRQEFSPLPFDPVLDEACMCMLPIGLERRKGIPYYIWRNEEIRAWLLDNNMVGNASTSPNYAMEWAPKVRQADAISKIIFFIFEAMVNNRWHELLYHIAFGPSQLNLRYTSLAADPTLPTNSKPADTMPHTWEEIWDLYTLRRGYLGTLQMISKHNNSRGMLPLDPTDQQMVTWLAIQTGGGPRNIQYAFGDPAKPEFGSGFISNFRACQSVANQLNW